MSRQGPISFGERIVLSAIGASAGAIGLGLVAYSGPLLRWSGILLDRLAAWAH